MRFFSFHETDRITTYIFNCICICTQAHKMAHRDAAVEALRSKEVKHADTDHGVSHIGRALHAQPEDEADGELR